MAIIGPMRDVDQREGVEDVEEREGAEDLAGAFENLVGTSRARVAVGRLKRLVPSPIELTTPHRYVPNRRLVNRLRSERYTHLGARRARTLIELARRVERLGIPGAIVDCGVWNGGSTILLGKGAPSREIWAFDSFEGMPSPGPGDPDADPDWEGRVRGSEEMLRSGFASYAGDVDRLQVVKGWFDQTLGPAAERMEQVALLHIDADWYDSVRMALESFYDKVAVGGYVAVDDLRMWQGASRATSEFRTRIGESAPIRAAYYWRKSASLSE
jgi:O-methyltransferase